MDQHDRPGPICYTACVVFSIVSSSPRTEGRDGAGVLSDDRGGSSGLLEDHFAYICGG